MANILAVAGPGSKYSIPGANGAGFWAGLWHGLISPITFIVSLFTPAVRIYEINNRGRWYDFRGTRLAVTYHPAFLLRDPRQKKEAWKDLQLVMKELGLPLP